MEILVHLEVVAGPLADHVEVVDESRIERQTVEMERLLGDSGRLVLGAGREAHPADALRLIVNVQAEIPRRALRQAKDLMQRTADVNHLASAAVRARDEHE